MSIFHLSPRTLCPLLLSIQWRCRRFRWFSFPRLLGGENSSWTSSPPEFRGAEIKTMIWAGCPILAKCYIYVKVLHLQAECDHVAFVWPNIQQLYFVKVQSRRYYGKDLRFDLHKILVIIERRRPMRYHEKTKYQSSALQLVFLTHGKVSETSASSSHANEILYYTMIGWNWLKHSYRFNSNTILTNPITEF